MQRNLHDIQDLVHKSMNTALVSSFAQTFIFNVSIQQLLSVVNTIQVVSHMPLMNIPLTGKSYFIFDILIDINSFELFPITDYVDFSFKKTEPWSEKFSWLGYETSNFIETLGTIFVIFILLLISGTFVLAYSSFSICRRIKCLTGYMNSTAYSKAVMSFSYESFFEIIICILISIKMSDIRKYWGGPEIFALST